jgi:hypothetical protein
MPAWVKGKDGEKAWAKAKAAAKKQYPGVEQSDPDKFYAIVTTIYKNICKSPDYDCRIGEEIETRTHMRHLIERLERIGNPEMRLMAVADLARKIRNFSGEMAMSLADKSDPYGELAATSSKVKQAGKKMVKSMQEFVKAVLETEKYIDVEYKREPRIKGRLGTGR